MKFQPLVIRLVLSAMTLLFSACDKPESERPGADAATPQAAASDGSGGGNKRDAEQGAQGKFPSGSSRRWKGFEKGKCGTAVQVSLPGGEQEALEMPERLLDGLETIELVTAEGNVRDTLTIGTLLDRYEADSVTFRGCDEQTKSLTRADDLDRYRVLLNGKGLLKLLEAQRGEPLRSPVKVITHVELHAGG